MPAVSRSPAKAAIVAASPTTCKKRKPGSRQQQGRPSPLKKAMTFVGHLKRAAALKKAKVATTLPKGNNAAKEKHARKPE